MKGVGPKWARPQKVLPLLLWIFLPPICDARQVFRLMLEVEPAAATIRDGFKLSPLQWAADRDRHALGSACSHSGPTKLPLKNDFLEVGNLEMFSDGAWTSYATTMAWLSFDGLKVAHGVTAVTYWISD